LIIGRRNASAVGTLVERCTNYTMLVHLPDGYKPEQVQAALADKIKTLPQALRESLTWDQGPEMRDWQQVKIAADIDIYFADPHSPWQRGINENTVSIEDGWMARSVRLVPAARGDSREY
jgi:transposase, IS30 family